SQCQILVLAAGQHNNRHITSGIVHLPQAIDSLAIGQRKVEYNQFEPVFAEASETVGNAIRGGNRKLRTVVEHRLQQPSVARVGLDKEYFHRAARYCIGNLFALDLLKDLAPVLARQVQVQQNEIG